MSLLQSEQTFSKRVVDIYLHTHIITRTMKRLNVNIPDDLHKKLKLHCVEQEFEMTKIVLKLIEEYLEKVEKKKSK
jgi:ParG